ncbi:Ohr family peroxiredoxin [Enterococcus hirae]
MTKVYEAIVSSHGGREGEVYSQDKRFKHNISGPGSNNKAATNPEELFAAGYSACFNGALQLVMKNKGLTNDSIVTAHVGLHVLPENNFHISVVLKIFIEGMNTDKSLLLAEEAHKICPYSKALDGNVSVKLEII